MSAASRCAMSSTGSGAIEQSRDRAGGLFSTFVVLAGADEDARAPMLSSPGRKEVQ
jgi:hypothetical protein